MKRFLPIALFVALLLPLLGFSQTADEARRKERMAPPDGPDKAIIATHNDYIGVQLDDANGKWNEGTYPGGLRLYTVNLLHLGQAGLWFALTVMTIATVRELWNYLLLILFHSFRIQVTLLISTAVGQHLKALMYSKPSCRSILSIPIQSLELATLNMT
jgi:hypothetical protein